MSDYIPQRLCINHCTYYETHRKLSAPDVCAVNRTSTGILTIEEISIGSSCLHPEFHPDSIEKRTKRESIEIALPTLPWSI